MVGGVGEEGAVEGEPAIGGGAGHAGVGDGIVGEFEVALLALPHLEVDGDPGGFVVLDGLLERAVDGVADDDEVVDDEVDAGVLAGGLEVEVTLVEGEGG